MLALLQLKLRPRGAWRSWREEFQAENVHSGVGRGSQVLPPPPAPQLSPFRQREEGRRDSRAAWGKVTLYSTAI